MAQVREVRDPGIELRLALRTMSSGLGPLKVNDESEL